LYGFHEVFLGHWNEFPEEYYRNISATRVLILEFALNRWQLITNRFRIVRCQPPKD
jgi:hypothetical protein